MKRILLLTATLFVLTSCTTPSSDTIVSRTEKELPKPNRFDIMRGVNISHWLSQSDRRGEERVGWFQEEDVAFIKKAGFDHIRLPIDEEQMWDEDGNKEKEAFELLQNGINWALKNDLKVIVDLHILRSHHFNNEVKPLFTETAAQEQFYNCWKELSGELKKYPKESVAYELMNEPVADNPEDWNKIVANAVATVRKLEPKRKILVGSNRWQSTDTFDDLKLPEKDPNLIVSFHFYTPMALTHYKAPWMVHKSYDGPVNYPGEIVKEEDIADLDANLKAVLRNFGGTYNKDSLENLIIKPIKYAQERNLQVYCGEWGCLKTLPEDTMLRWYKDVKTILEDNNVSWTIWDYKGSFGIRYRENNQPDTELIKLLTGVEL
ncbi:MAG: glycosyl hydrolase family 5 [Thalassobius sp.]|nr:glycosyl hydrolase family 5 [Thalassovita sp.]